ncbi:simple sugar transport system permease protein [Oscillospiraceae bacterium]|nr:simple sugar transport system permease protein [Oscillospiraceae bacterium]
MSSNTVKKQTSLAGLAKSVVRKQIFIPIAALLILVLFNLIADPSFFQITLQPNSEGYNVLSGNIISIIDRASELVILAIGMTLVTSASGGQDISVGATIAIAGSVVLRVLCGSNTRPDTLQAPVIVAFIVCCLVSMLFGAFNGTLVAYFKIQPMVATLIMFTAGRSIAAWINNNELPVISDPKFAYYGNFIPGIPIPTPVFITAACLIVIALVLKFTNLRLYSQAVGINPHSSRLNGINPQMIKFITFVILGLCVAVAGFIKVSRLSTINYSVVAKDIEMDAILAVALGGNALGGGKFNMTASVIGAYVIQFLTTTLYKYDVDSAAISAYKAVVVIILVVLSAPIVREKMGEVKKKLFPAKTAKEAA